jgi:dihydrolipoamide dehydrogenase
LNLPAPPAHLLVIGGGYIGLELGEAYAKMGSRVTVVEATEEILPGIEAELKRPLLKRLHALGILVYLKTRFQSCRPEKEGLTVTLQPEAGPPLDLPVSHILVAVGRSPRSKGWGLEKTSVTLDEKGFIVVNASRQTSLPQIYAIGDVAGGMMLAHKAFREGVVAAEHIAGQKAAFDNQVPAVIFTDPEIAYVGLTQTQAREMGAETETGLFGFGVNGRALTLHETEGFIRVVAEKGSGRLLGVQMTGPHVSDLISEATLAIEMGATAEDLALTIHPHPTLSEALHEAAEGVMGMSIHRYQRKR